VYEKQHGVNMAKLNVVKIANNMAAEYRRTQSLQMIVNHPSIAQLVRNPHIFSRAIKIVCEHLSAEHLMNFVSQVKTLTPQIIQEETTKRTVECIGTHHWNNSSLLAHMFDTLFCTTQHAHIFFEWSKLSDRRHLIGEYLHNLSPTDRQYVEAKIMQDLYNQDDFLSLIKCIPYFNNTNLVILYFHHWGRTEATSKIICCWRQVSNDQKIVSVLNEYIQPLPRYYRERITAMQNETTHKVLSEAVAPMCGDIPAPGRKM